MTSNQFTTIEAWEQHAEALEHQFHEVKRNLDEAKLELERAHKHGLFTGARLIATPEVIEYLREQEFALCDINNLQPGEVVVMSGWDEIQPYWRICVWVNNRRIFIPIEHATQMRQVYLETNHD